MRLIDADALMKKWGLDNATKYGNFTADEREFSYSMMSMYEIADMIEAEPTVDPVKRGKWEFYDQLSPTLECSECRGLAGWDGCGDYPSVASKYCPNCGAKMDKED